MGKRSGDDRRDEGDDFLDRLARVDQSVGSATLQSSESRSPENATRCGGTAASVNSALLVAETKAKISDGTLQDMESSPLPSRPSRRSREKSNRSRSKLKVEAKDDDLEAKIQNVQRRTGVTREAALAALEQNAMNASIAIHTLDEPKRADSMEGLEDVQRRLANLQARFPAASQEVLRNALKQTNGHAGKAGHLVEKRLRDPY